MNHLIVPAVLADNAEDGLRKIAQVASAAPWIQIDAADGKFVANTSWYDASAISAANSPSLIEMHLMVTRPDTALKHWYRVPTFKRAIWHVETRIDHAGLIMDCRTRGIEVGLGLSPSTSVDAVLPFAHKLDTVLVMGVEPGFNGQELIPETIEKVAELRERAPHLTIGFDGGIRPKHFQALIDAGVTFFYMGSIFRDEDPSSYLQTQQALLDSLAVPSQVLLR